MDSDIIGELRRFMSRTGDDVPVSLVPKELIKKTIKRIEFLRLHAGAITEGEMFDDIAERTPRRTGEEPCKTSD